MHALRLIWVGKTRKGYAAEGVANYLKRIRPLCPLDCVELKPATHSGRAADNVREKESDAILKRLTGREAVVLLDERGRQPDSREWAAMLGKLMEISPSATTFVLGGAYGVDERIRSRATEVVSLSRLTFPHQLARVILLEQIYRGLTLLSGHAYHHE